MVYKILLILKNLIFYNDNFKVEYFFFVFFEALKQNKISENVSEIHFSFIIQLVRLKKECHILYILPRLTVGKFGTTACIFK